jgi:hypothetical protein
MRAKNLWQLFLAAVVAATAAHPRTAMADVTFYWHPNSPFGLGRCVDLRDMSAKQDAFEEAPEVAVERGARSINVYARQIETTEQLARERFFDLSIEGGLKLKAFTLGGKLNAAYAGHVDASDNSIQFIFKAELDFGDYRLKDLRLKEEARALVGQPEEFQKRYGNYYVVQARRAASVIAHVTVSDISHETKRELSADLKTEFTFKKIVEGKSNASFKEKLRQLDKEGKVHVDFYATGGDGKLDEVAFNGVDGALAFMKRYVEKISADSAPSVEYRLASFETFGADLPRTDPAEWEFYKQGFLLENKFSHVQQRIRSELNVLQRGNPEAYSEKVGYFKEIQHKYAAATVALYDAVKNAKVDKKYDLGAIQQHDMDENILWLLEPVKDSSLQATAHVASPLQLVDKIGIHVDLRLHSPGFVQSLIFYKYDAKGNRVVLNDVSLTADSTGNRRGGLIDAFRAGVAGNPRTGDRDRSSEIRADAAQSTYFVQVTLKSGTPVIVELGSPDLTQLR